MEIRGGTENSPVNLTGSWAIGSPPVLETGHSAGSSPVSPINIEHILQICYNFWMEKICCTCKLPRLLNLFGNNKNEDDGLSPKCKICCQKYDKEYYHKIDKQKRKKRVKENKESITQWFVEYKKTLKCSKCNEDHPACLDFHHLRDKKFDVSCMISRCYAIETIQEEIAKCVVLCANCHRKLHWGHKFI